MLLLRARTLMVSGSLSMVEQFYHQRYGVTWEPEVVVHDLAAECAADDADAVCLIIASDGVWDHWEFDEAIAALCDLEAPLGQPLTTRTRVMQFFEDTRAKGEEAFGDGADNLTGVVAVFPRPPPAERDVGIGA